MLSCSITFGSSPATYFAFTASDLPIVMINTNGQGISDDPKIMADMGIVYNGPGQRNQTALNNSWCFFRDKNIGLTSLFSGVFVKIEYPAFMKGW